MAERESEKIIKKKSKKNKKIIKISYYNHKLINKYNIKFTLDILQLYN